MTGLRLRHVAEVNPTTPEFDVLPSDAELSFVPLEAVRPRAFDASAVRTKSAVSTGYTRFREGDVLVPKITPTFQADRTVIASGLLGGVGAGTTELHVVRAGATSDRRYLRYLLSSSSFLQFGAASMVGVAGQKRVPDAVLRDLYVPIADLAHQRRIADFLDVETARIDELLKVRSRTMALDAERLRLAVNLAVSSAAAPSVSLRRYAVSISQGVSSQAGARPADCGEWGVLKLSAVKWGAFYPRENKVLPSDWPVDVSLQPQAGDLLVTRSNTPLYVGDVCAITTDAPGVLLPDLIYRVRLRPGLDVRFASYALRTDAARWYFTSSARGTSQSMVKLRGEDVLDVRVPVLSLDQQRAISDELDAEVLRVEDLNEVIREQAALLVERRRALITAAVTGDIEVP